MEGPTMAGEQTTSSSSSSSSASASAASTSAGASTSRENTEREKKRRRTEVRKIEEKGNLFVTYSKRRRGLYSKAGQLCEIATGAQAAVITFSPSGKVCAFGNPSVDAVVDRYLLGQNIANNNDVVASASAAESREEEEEEEKDANNNDDDVMVAAAESEEEEKEADNNHDDVLAAAADSAAESGEEENEEEEEGEELKVFNDGDEVERLRCDNSEENMDLEELMEYKARLEGLRSKVDLKFEEVRRRDCTRIFF